ncbi:MAG: hypothetical protein CVU64_01510 [Deltaproteobacteria bacterium HGW-Deltaproteobacteria-21]|nr:MAG: hypothetical protein CVU64_01510 [Deltaproteobacteria bacterium HGW-Deltaproteobacteria-21]
MGPAASSAIDKYVQSMVGAGYKEEEIKARIQYIRDRIGFWKDKQISMKIKSVTGRPPMR